MIDAVDAARPSSRLRILLRNPSFACPAIPVVALGDGAIRTAVGLATGIAGAGLRARARTRCSSASARTILLTFAGVAAFLAAGTLAATFLAAYRATLVDPIALRNECPHLAHP
jgi:hypothetical protein